VEMGYYEDVYKSQRKDFEHRSMKEFKTAQLYTNIFNINNKSAKIIDCGGADGLFLYGLKKLGYTNLKGFDLDPNAVAFANQLMPDVSYTVGDVTTYFNTDEKYDVIFIMDVLEHLDLEEGEKLIRSFKKVLSTDGMVILRFPNAGTVYNNHSLYDDITHKTYYSFLSIKQVMLQSGYKETDFVIMNDPSVVMKAKLIRKLIYKMCSLLDFMVMGIHNDRYKYQYTNLLVKIQPIETAMNNKKHASAESMQATVTSSTKNISVKSKPTPKP
jgi:2-polyprenyl-3-methyl-5-hydroxy-6-metoxy-1,4-benzoquinol methylase